MSKIIVDSSKNKTPRTIKIFSKFWAPSEHSTSLQTLSNSSSFSRCSKILPDSFDFFWFFPLYLLRFFPIFSFRFCRILSDSLRFFRNFSDSSGLFQIISESLGFYQILLDSFRVSDIFSDDFRSSQILSSFSNVSTILSFRFSQILSNSLSFLILSDFFL